MNTNSLYRAVLLLTTLLVAGCGALPQLETDYPKVKPLIETVSVASRDDAADDPAIWINQAAPERSWIAGTDKQAGLYIFDLQGEILDFAPLGRVNNVDVIGPWTNSGVDYALAVLTERSQPRLLVVLIEADSGRISQNILLAEPLIIGDPYGVCASLNNSAADTQADVVVTSKEGRLQQYRIVLDDTGSAQISLQRTLDVGSTSEGCVMDAGSNSLYLAEEAVGIWHYPLDPVSGNSRRLIADVADSNLVADVEGLSIAADGHAGGWLIASSQGDSSFAVYKLPEHNYLGSFRIDAHLARGIDAVSGTDGIAAATTNVLADYPGGLFVAQDDMNEPGESQNFKFVAWADILAVIR